MVQHVVGVAQVSKESGWRRVWLAGFGLFFVPEDDFRERSEEASYFLFPFLCKGDGGGGARPCSNCFAFLPQDYYYGAYY